MKGYLKKRFSIETKGAKWMTPNQVSQWAFQRCADGENTQEMRDMITNSHWAYLYCKTIENREEIAIRITDPIWAWAYCQFLEGMPHLLNHEKWKKVYETIVVFARWSPRYMTSCSSSGKIYYGGYNDSSCF